MAAPVVGIRTDDNRNAAGLSGAYTRTRGFHDLAVLAKAFRAGTERQGPVRYLKPQAHLHFQSPVVGVLRKALAILIAGHLVGLPKQWRRNISDDRALVSVIQQIAYR